MPAPPEMCTFLPICAHEPTVAQVSTIVPSSTKAPIFTNEGISTTFLAMNAPRRTIAPGTARKPALANLFSLQPANFDGTLSHHGPPPAAAADQLIGVDAEREQHRLLQPLLGYPAAVRATRGDARAAIVEQRKRGLDGFGVGALALRRERVAPLPGGVDLGGEIGVGHGSVLAAALSLQQGVQEIFQVVRPVIDIGRARLGVDGADENSGEAQLVRGLQVAQRVLEQDGARGVDRALGDELLVRRALRLGREPGGFNDRTGART